MFSLFSKKNQSVTEFLVEGMHCNKCADNLKNLLLKIPNVKKAEVNFKEKTAKVTFCGEVPTKLIQERARSIGFELNKIK